MATSNTNSIGCPHCGKTKATSKCTGCTRDFCVDHLAEHQQNLRFQLDHITNNHNMFRQSFNEYRNNSQIEKFIQQIDQWEEEAIFKIHQTASECRQSIIEGINENIRQIEVNFNELTVSLGNIRKVNDFNENDLGELDQKLNQLKQQFLESSHISIREDSTTLLSIKIPVIESIESIQTDKPISKWNYGIYSIKSVINKKIVTAGCWGMQSLAANRYRVNQWEKFEIIILDKQLNHIALRAIVNGKYVTAAADGKSPLIAKQTTIGEWETFQLIECADDIVIIKSIGNNQFVSVKNSGSLIADQEFAGVSEQFQLSPVY